ncbi:MAG: hypothetical protein NTZ37_09105 [Methanoregula sp.]|nr:hypothetical protein [Methanoregula sp.]
MVTFASPLFFRDADIVYSPCFGPVKCYRPGKLLDKDIDKVQPEGSGSL